jgi:hypothetical protein
MRMAVNHLLPRSVLVYRDEDGNPEARLTPDGHR